METVERFRLFLERVEELKQSRLLRSQSLHAKLTVKWDGADGQLSTVANMPDGDDLKAFLVTFRHFFMKREPVYLGRIFNLLQQQITDEEIKGWVRQSREYWKKSLKSGGIQVTFDDLNMTPEHVAEVLINGYYFHSDPKYREELTDMLPVGRDITDVLFVDFLVRTTRIISYLGGVTSHCLREGLFKDAPTTRLSNASSGPTD